MTAPLWSSVGSANRTILLFSLSKGLSTKSRPGAPITRGALNPSCWVPAVGAAVPMHQPQGWGARGTFYLPSSSLGDVELGGRSGAAPGQRSQLGISLLSSWFRQERRCAGYLPCNGQPGWLALSFVTIELSRFQPGVHGSVENAAVSAGCNVSSGASEAASAFYLGSARGTALPRPRGKPKPLRLMPMHPHFGLAEGALLLGGHVQGPH